MSEDESSKNCTQCKLPLARRERICKRCGTRVVLKQPQFLTLAPDDSHNDKESQRPVPVVNGDFANSDPEQVGSFSQNLLRQDLISVLGTLSFRERDVVKLRFGLDDGIQRTLEEVAKFLGITRERARLIEAKALRALRHPSRKTPDIQSAKRIQRKELVNVLNNFSSAEQEILMLKWGFKDGRCHSAQEISDLLGVPIKQIRQLEGQVFTPPEAR